MSNLYKYRKYSRRNIASLRPQMEATFLNIPLNALINISETLIERAVTIYSRYDIDIKTQEKLHEFANDELYALPFRTASENLTRIVHNYSVYCHFKQLTTNCSQYYQEDPYEYNVNGIYRFRTDSATKHDKALTRIEKIRKNTYFKVDTNLVREDLVW